VTFSGRLGPLLGVRLRSRAALGGRHYKCAKAASGHTWPYDVARRRSARRGRHKVRNRATRSLSTEERDKIASIASSKPKIDLEINFEFNSAVLGSKAMPQVAELGKALTSADLKGRTFILAVSRRSARSRTKKPDAVTSEMHRCISPDKQQRPGWKERYAPPFRPSRRGGRAPGKQACARSLEQKSPDCNQQDHHTTRP
jgi:hypothetical protein